MKANNEEQSKLAEYEAAIQHNLGAFHETGQALLKIRDELLYRATHATFEGYCRERWDMVASRARQLIGAAEVVENLQSVTIVTPATESQARELAGLNPEQQRQIWEKVIETAPDGHITAAHIRKTREALINSPEQESLFTLEDYREAIADHVDAANHHGREEKYHRREAIRLRDEAFKKFGVQIELPFEMPSSEASPDLAMPASS